MPKKYRKTISLELPFKALSTNKLYSGVKRRSYHYKNFRRDVLKFLEDNYSRHVKLEGNLVLTMEVGFSSPLADVSNSVKGIEDVVAEYFNFNDRQIVTLHVDKYRVAKGDEYIKFKLRGTNKNIDRRKR